MSISFKYDSSSLIVPDTQADNDIQRFDINKKIARFRRHGLSAFHAKLLECFLDFLDKDGIQNLIENLNELETAKAFSEHAQRLYDALLIPSKQLTFASFNLNSKLISSTVKAKGRKTSAISPSPRTGAIDDINAQTALYEGISQTHSQQKALKDACMARDDHKCMVSGLVDINVYRRLDPHRRAGERGSATMACAHIIPFSLGKIEVKCFDVTRLLDQCPVWVPIPSVWCADLYHVGTVCRGFHIAYISACRICAFLRVYNELFAHS